MTISVTVGGKVWTGWTSASATRAIDQFASTFAMQVTDKPWSARPSDPVVISLDGEPVISGRIDRRKPSYSANGRSMSVPGRSYTAKLVDCADDYSPAEMRGLTATQIVTALADPLGVAVRVEGDSGAAIPLFAPEPGATAADVIEEVARLRGLIAGDDADGNLVLRGPDTWPAGGVIERGKNILAASADIASDTRYSHIIVKAVRSGVATDVVAVQGVATDDRVSDYRPLVIIAPRPMSPAEATAYAEYEMAARYGSSLIAKVTVDGWRDGDGALWDSGKILYLDDDWLGVSAHLLASRVTWSMGPGGPVTEIDLVRPETFAREPIVQTKPVIPKADRTVAREADNWADAAFEKPAR